jgi:hypothetical protein
MKSEADFPFRRSHPCDPAHFLHCFLSTPAQEAFGPPGHSGPWPTRPLRPMAHPVPSLFLRTPEPPPPLPARRRAMRHRVSPSRARMEMNRRSARPPSPSRTSSVPRQLLSLIQCRNRRVKNPPPADPLPSPPPSPRGYKRPLLHHSTTP